jgi:hypothetical protein
MTPLERVTERVSLLGHPDDPSTPRPLLTVAEFFDGNDSMGSIGCNLPGEPRPGQFQVLFVEFASKAEVKDIRVQVTAFDVPEWPFSDTVFIVTSADADEVAGWFPEELAPDEVFEGFVDGQNYEPYQVPDGWRVMGCWWD